jgi:hypothetical protein
VLVGDDPCSAHLGNAAQLALHLPEIHWPQGTAARVGAPGDPVVSLAGGTEGCRRRREVR